LKVFQKNAFQKQETKQVLKVFQKNAKSFNNTFD